jgi:hypothetical protein
MLTLDNVKVTRGVMLELLKKQYIIKIDNSQEKQ